MSEWRASSFNRSGGQEFRYVGIQGWRSFLGAKKTMLDAYDQARVNAKEHKIEVSHGPVAEAFFRKWLSDFLPKTYGVTSGFIVSQGEQEDVKLHD
jgi:hypothetical protein